MTLIHWNSPVSLGCRIWPPLSSQWPVPKYLWQKDNWGQPPSPGPVTKQNPFRAFIRCNCHGAETLPPAILQHARHRRAVRCLSRVPHSVASTLQGHSAMLLVSPPATVTEEPLRKKQSHHEITVWRLSDIILKKVTIYAFSLPSSTCSDVKDFPF